MAGRSKERCAFFNRKRKQQQHHPGRESSRRPSDSPLVINVGIIAKNEKGNLSVVRGSKIPLKVCKDFSSEQTLTAAVKTHTDDDQFFSAAKDYVLLYPDQKLVKYVPGMKKDLSVTGYMKELSKPYSKLDLFLCKTHEYTQHIAEAEGNEDMATESFIEVMDESNNDICMSTSDTGTANRSIVQESDVVVLKEIFPDTAEVDIKRALQMGLGSRDKAAAYLMTWETPDY